MKKVNIITSLLLVIIGFIHVGFSFLEFQSISEDALWFASGGLFISGSGIFNLFIAQSKVELQNGYLLKVVNCLLVLFLLLMVVQLPMLPGFIALGCSIYLVFFNHCR